MRPVVVTAMLLLWASRMGHALISAPTFEAAQRMGHEVVGEVEFASGATSFDHEALAGPLKELGRSCPLGPEPTTLHLILLAWSDQEYPSRFARSSAADVKLAEHRARTIRRSLASQLPFDVDFKIINMATRAPQRLTSGVRGKHPGRRENVKRILEAEGAAPTDSYQIGLFGEYAQSHKVLIWANCDSTMSPHSHPRFPQVQIADNFVP